MSLTKTGLVCGVVLSIFLMDVRPSWMAADDVSPGDVMKDLHRMVERNVLAAYFDIPVTFVPNAGQHASHVLYSGRGPGYGFYFTRQEAVFVFAQPPSGREGLAAVTAAHPRGAARSEPARPARGVSLALGFLGANPTVRVEGRRESRATVNYFVGNDRGRVWI